MADDRSKIGNQPSTIGGTARSVVRREPTTDCSESIGELVIEEVRRTER
jgi:hypothetical protein